MVHAFGERAHSGTCPRSPEEKAWPLRSGHLGPPSQEVTHAVTAADPQVQAGGRVGSVQGSQFDLGSPGTREVSGPKPKFTEGLRTHGGSCRHPDGRGGVAVSWHKARGAPSGESLRPRPGATSSRTTLEAQQPGTEGAGIQRERALPGKRPQSLFPRAKDEADDSRVQPQADVLEQTVPLAMASSQGARSQEAEASPGDQRLDRWRKRGPCPH